MFTNARFVIAVVMLPVLGLCGDTNTTASVAVAIPPLFKNPERPIAERVADLIGRMTLEEKVSLFYMDCPAVERLGIPGYGWWTEAIYGAGREGPATIFPLAIARAATWDVDLVSKVGVAISDELRIRHRKAPTLREFGLTCMAPFCDLARDPRWGRIQETFGEDPYLVSQMAVGFIRGLQGDNPRYLKTAATIKHFAAHSQETGRSTTSFDVSQRSLREYYFVPFQAGVTQGKAACCMVGYNGLNGTPCTGNKWLLTDVLRGEWGFEGVVLSDYGGSISLFGQHHYVDSREKAIATSITGGVDVLLEPEPIITNTLHSVQQKLMSEEDLNKALTRAFTLRFRLGMFDPPELVPYTQIPASVFGSAEHLALARETSRASLVLLKNEPPAKSANPTPILPLDRRKLESIAVVGLYADQIQVGTYASTPAVPVSKPVTVLQGVMNHVSERIVVRQAPWFDVDSPVNKEAAKKNPNLPDQKASVEAAVKAAALSDVVVVVIGLSAKNENEGKDRIDLDLPKDQQEYVEKIFAANPSTVVVLFNGGPLSVNWLQAHVPAIIEAWYPGQQGGDAIADVLFGDYNPAGRLPMTSYSSIDQQPPLNDYEIMKGRTYMYFKGKPLYPFGYGLSYTKFEYSNLRLDREKATAKDTVNISVDVKNVGEVDGDEVVQLYVTVVDARIPVPIKQLRGFRRLNILRGKTETVTLPLKIADMGFWDEEHKRWQIEPGRYEVQIGASSADIRLHENFRVEPD